MANLRVDQLITYPVKSLGGVPSSRVVVTDTGFEHDRRWMLVDEDGSPVTLRDYPVLSHCKVRLEGEYITVDFRGDEVWLPLRPGVARSGSITVKIWGDEVEASAADAEIDAWFSKILSFPTRVVYIRDDSLRRVNPAYAGDSHQTSFTDGFPVLVALTASLAELNSRLEQPIPVSRFRPNLVVSGGAPFEEDYWGQVRVGDATLRGVKPCSRCVVTTVDAHTAKPGKEPLKTLATFRRWGNHVFFAENMVVDEAGSVSLGDQVEVRTRRTEAEVAKVRA